MGTIRHIIRGVQASALGTLAMDTLLYRRYRNAGGESAFLAWESSEGVEGWENAPAPALVAKRLLESATGRELAPQYARLLNNVTHWGFGLAMGAGFGLLAGSRTPKPWTGPPFGAAVWGSGYVVLPLLGVYEPIWHYDRKTLGKDLSAHLVFGTATAAAYSALAAFQTSTGDR